MVSERAADNRQRSEKKKRKKNREKGKKNEWHIERRKTTTAYNNRKSSNKRIEIVEKKRFVYLKMINVYFYDERCAGYHSRRDASTPGLHCTHRGRGGARSRAVCE